jgi:hypothetical protein
MALLATACFDTQEVEIATRVSVDDFEDGDELANDASGFGPWWCDAYPAGDGHEAAARCELSAGFESTFAESLTFSLQETSGATPVGAILGVSPVAPTRDLRSFKRIGFKAKLDPGEPAPPPQARLICELGCASADAALDDVDTDVTVASDGVEVSDDWSTYSLSLGAFRQPFWQGQLIDEASCFSLVDSIRFRLDSQLTVEGEAAVGTLAIDDVYLE